ncbi:MAG: Uma2 family endonuclease [Planctomycetes bacterium]|nr:Uma2 family endonuclease [Planctomycetota bacterium]
MSTAASQTAPPVTPEDLLAMPDGDRYELVDGELVERYMGMQSSYVGSRLNRYLGAYCDETGIGAVFDAEGGYQCFADQPNKVRRLDVSFIAADRLAAESLPAGYSRMAPDLAVEVVSPNDVTEQVFRKVYEYIWAREYAWYGCSFRRRRRCLSCARRAAGQFSAPAMSSTARMSSPASAVRWTTCFVPRAGTSAPAPT